MRVLQLVTDTDRRGAQVFGCDLGEALAARGHGVTTVALAPGEHGGLELPVLGPRRRSAETLRAVRRRARSADVVVAHGSTTLPVAALALAGTGVPFVYRQISESLFWAPTPARRLRVRAALGRASRVVALSATQADVLVRWFGVPRTRIAVIPNGVPAGRFPPVGPGARAAARAALGLDGDAPVVAVVSALVEEKGVDLAVEAVAALSGALGATRLLVAGDGPRRTALEQAAAAALGPRAHVVGSLADVLPAYQAADVVVLPSRGGDSMPATLIEAALVGVPVVATPVGAIGELVEDGVTGRLVPVGSVEALTAAVAATLADPGGAAGHAARARARALERYEIDVVAAAWERVLVGALD